MELAPVQLHGVTKGVDALGEISIRTKVGRVVVSAKGPSTDIVHTSALAYLAVTNRAGVPTRKIDYYVEGWAGL